MTSLNLGTLQNLVIQWAEDRNIIKGSTPRAQAVKLMEEYGELNAAVARDDVEKVKDSIGDCLVVALIMRAQLGDNSDLFSKISTETIEDCYEVSVKQWNVLHGAEHLGRAIYLLLRNVLHKDFDLIEHIDKFAASLADLAYCYDTSLKECLNIAYNEIKDRKGTMVDGIYIKE